MIDAYSPEPPDLTGEDLNNKDRTPSIPDKPRRWMGWLIPGYSLNRRLRAELSSSFASLDRSSDEAVKLSAEVKRKSEIAFQQTKAILKEWEDNSEASLRNMEEFYDKVNREAGRANLLAQLIHKSGLIYKGGEPTLPLDYGEPTDEERQLAMNQLIMLSRENVDPPIGQLKLPTEADADSIQNNAIIES